MILVLLPQEGKGQEEDKSTQGDEKDKGQGHLCLAQGLHPDQGLDQGQGTGKVDMMVRYRILAVNDSCCALFMFCLIEVMVEGKKDFTCCLNSYLEGYRILCFLHPSLSLLQIKIIISLKKKTTHNLCITPVLPSLLPTLSM